MPMLYKPLLYQGCSVVFQEVPDEIALAFNIADCPHRCSGCHSQALWEYAGLPLMDHFVDEVKAHPGVTCVCFMGGEWRPRELILYSRIAHKFGLKACLYSGSDKMIDGQLLSHLDYLKTGSFQEENGPLNDINTNQRMFRLRDDQNRPAVFDITHRFRKEYL